MPRYIADSYLYRAVGADIDGACGRCIQDRSNCMRYSLSRMDICGIIEDSPTVDVMEIVRCKDCKYRDDDDFCTGRGYPNVLVPDDGFCDKGKRRD